MIYMAKKKKYYKNENKNFKDNDIGTQAKSFIIILVVIVLILALIWFIMELKAGTFSKKNTDDSANESNETINYDQILAGETFNRKDNEYYVIFTDSSKDFYNVYQSYMTNSDKKIYIVDLANTLNSKYISDESNSTAQSASELKVKDNTLIKISNKQNILYLEGYNNVINELKN